MRLLLVVVSFSLLALAWGKVQSAAVKGKLMCNGQPAGDVTVKLYDEDFLDPDDLMAEGVSSADGSFQLSGKESGVFSIKPKLNVYHKCNPPKILKSCLHKFSIVIPKEYIKDGEVSDKVYDIGEINLANEFSGQKIDCWN